MNILFSCCCSDFVDMNSVGIPRLVRVNIFVKDEVIPKGRGGGGGWAIILCTNFFSSPNCLQEFFFCNIPLHDIFFKKT